MNLLEMVDDKSGCICCTACKGDFFFAAIPEGPNGETWYSVTKSEYNRWKKDAWARSMEITNALMVQRNKELDAAQAQAQAQA